MKKEILLLVAASLTGCMVEANGNMNLASSLRNINNQEDKSDKPINSPREISPVFANTSNAYLASLNGGADVYVDQDENGKPVFFMDADIYSDGDGYQYTSKKMSYDKDGFVNIDFDSAELVPTRKSVSQNRFATGGSNSSSNSEKNTLILGGNATNLSYTDFGMFKTTANGDVSYSPVVMYTFNRGTPDMNYGTSAKFTGKTVAVLDGPNGYQDLKGDVNITIKNGNNGYRADLELDYKDYKRFKGENLTFNGSNLYGEMRGGTQFNGNVGFYGENDIATEAIATYTLDNPTTGEYIDGAFGVKNKDGIPYYPPCNCK